jgi:phage-related protein
MEVISVPGRNGDIIITQDAYTNTTLTYDLAIVGLEKTLNDSVRAVMEWLTRPKGYARLEDSYNPDVFRMAYYQGGMDIENRFMTLGRAKVQFNCKPQRFLRSGERSILAYNGVLLANPTIYTAKPIIAVKGTGSAVLTVGSSVLSISDISPEIDIDCESQSAYYGTANRNSRITLTSGDFPELKEGSTQISWTGSGVTEVRIIPRWWII